MRIGGMRPTARQREFLTRMAAGDRLIYVDGESVLCLITSEGVFLDRMYGGMRHRLTRNGWLKGREITDAGRAALESS